MEILADFLNLFKPVYSGIYWLFAGQFIPPSCTWCRPFFWVSEVALVVVIVFYFSSQGPISRN